MDLWCNPDIAVGLPKFDVLSKNTKIIVNYSFGIGLFAWLGYSIYHQIIQQRNLPVALHRLIAGLSGSGQWLLGLISLLMIANWTLEAVKWRILISPLEKLSLGKALKAVFSGVAIAISTPNRIGEFGGRILYLREESRLEAIPLTFVGSLAQLIATFCIGIPACGFLLFYPLFILQVPFLSSLLVRIFLLTVLCGFLTGLLLLYFKLDVFRKWMLNWPLLARMDKYFRGLSFIGNKSLKWLLLLSVTRFVIFSAQYLFLLQIFGVQIPVNQGFLAVSMLYLVLSVIPTVAVAELGIRGQIGLLLLGLFSSNKLGIVAATVGIWLINLLFPALIGTLLLVGIKVYKNPNIVTQNSREL